MSAEHPYQFVVPPEALDALSELMELALLAGHPIPLSELRGQLDAFLDELEDRLTGSGVAVSDEAGVLRRSPMVEPVALDSFTALLTLWLDRVEPGLGEALWTPQAKDPPFVVLLGEPGEC